MIGSMMYEFKENYAKSFRQKGRLPAGKRNKGRTRSLGPSVFYSFVPQPTLKEELDRGL